MVRWLHMHLVNTSQEMRMQHTLSIRSAVFTLAAAALLVPDVVTAQRGTYSSRSHGPTFGVSLAGVGLSTRRGDGNTATEFTGSGVQMEVGWNMLESHFGLLVDYASMNINDGGPPNVRRYSHIGGLGRYMFRSDRDIVRPYLEVGISRREITARTSGDSPRNARTQSIGGAIGGGMQVFLARPVALDFGAQLGLGGFQDWESDDDVISSLPEVTQSTAVIRLGLRFWPGY